VKNSFLVVGLGEVLWDLYPDEQYLGGAPANATIHASQLGAHGVVVSGVGQDRLGDELFSALYKKGIDTKYIQKNPDLPTGTVLVQLDKDRNPQFTCSKNVAFDYLQWNGEFDPLIKNADAVLVGTLAQRNPVSRQTIQTFLERASDCVIVFDVNFRGWDESVETVVEETLIHTDLLKMNVTELHDLQNAFGKTDRSVPVFLSWLIETYDLKLAVLSLGQRGCLISDGEKNVISPGVKIYPVDTTGCGDAFVAGVVMKSLEGCSLEETAEFANYLGAFVATKQGAVPDYSLDEFTAFMQSHRDRVEVTI
jgi:fructokinase